MRIQGGGEYSLYLPIIVVIIGAANRKYFKRRSAANGLQHHAYSDKRCLFNQLEEAEVEIDLFQDGSKIKDEHHSTNILVLLVLAAPISAHTDLFTTW
jgi:hypothetical protein